jgi:hypothetical protein
MCIVHDAIMPLVLAGPRTDGHEWPKDVLEWAINKAWALRGSNHDKAVRCLSESQEARYAQYARYWAVECEKLETRLAAP